MVFEALFKKKKSTVNNTKINATVLKPKSKLNKWREGEKMVYR